MARGTASVTSLPRSAVSKHDRFIAAAEKRVDRALKAIRLVGSLATDKRFEHTPAERDAVFVALREGVDSAEKRFKETPVQEKFTFNRS